MKKSIPTTRADFANIIKSNSLYVDKTQQIYDCILGAEVYHFLARPRRFGKSLLCSTLRELFSGNKELFKGLWIEQTDWKWDIHPIIHLDMTFAAGVTNTITGMQEALRNQLGDIAKKYAVSVDFSQTIPNVFERLTVALSEKMGKGVVIIIDEYDKPILDKVDNPDERKIIHAALRDFYAPLKPLEKYVHRVFLTGVYKFTQTSIFSNLNNLNDLTFNPKAGTLVGYTENEIKKYFNNEVDKLASDFSCNQNDMIVKLRERYNGYCFGINVNNGELSQRVYNSFALNNVFAHLQMVDKWFESGSPRFLIQKIKEGKFEEFKGGKLFTDFGNLKNSCTPDAITATSLFYYAGYATIRSYNKDTRKVLLEYPNMEVSEATSKELLNLFKTNQSPVVYDLAYDIGQALRTHSFEQLKELFNQALAQVTYQIIESKEKYFHLIIWFLLQMGRLRAEAEVPTNDGRMDIVVWLPNEIIIIEVKFNEPAVSGLAQIKEKDYAKKFRSEGKQLTAIGLSVALGDDVEKNKCVVDVATLTLN